MPNSRIIPILLTLNELIRDTDGALDPMTQRQQRAHDLMKRAKHDLAKARAELEADETERSMKE